MNAQTETSLASKQNASFESRFRLDTGKALAYFDTPTGSAFVVHDGEEPSRDLYGLVHDPYVPTRPQVYDSLIRTPFKFIAHPVSQGVMTVPVEDGPPAERLVTVFEAPPGVPLVMGAVRVPVQESFIRGPFLRSVLSILARMHAEGLAHRNIRPQNIFFSGDESLGVSLGECCSAPAGSAQPSWYETLLRSDCHVMGRGEGSVEDDIYALGMTILELSTGRSLVKPDVTEDQIYEGRARRSSFDFFVREGELSLSLNYLLRGLLADNPKERWSLEDVARWVDGQAPKRLPADKIWSLSRPTAFGGKSYSDRRLLARALSRNVTAGAEFLRQMETRIWVQHSIPYQEFPEELERTIDVKSGDGNTQKQDSVEVARFCAYLDPYGPMRYNGLTLSYDSFPCMLAYSFKEEERNNLTQLDQMLGADIPFSLMQVAVFENEGLKMRMKRWQSRSEVVKSRALGQGIERVLYDMNPDQPCLCPRFATKWITTVRGAILAIETDLGTGGNTRVFDRHFTAFCASKAKPLARIFLAMSSSDMPQGRSGVALMEAMGALQHHLKLGRLPNWSRALNEAMKQSVRALHNTQRKSRLEKRLGEIVSAGDIKMIVDAMDLPAEEHLDRTGFNVASARFTRLERDRKKYLKGITATDKDAIVAGYKSTSSFAWLALLALVFYYINDYYG